MRVNKQKGLFYGQLWSTKWNSCLSFWLRTGYWTEFSYQRHFQRHLRQWHACHQCHWLGNEVNMSSLARKVGVTVGTLTIAINAWSAKNMYSEPAVRQTVVLFSYHSPKKVRLHSDITQIFTQELWMPFILLWRKKNVSSDQRPLLIWK